MMCRRISGWLIKCGVIGQEEQELYEYAIHSLILEIAPIILVGIFGILMGAMLQGIILIVPFMLIRKFSGGFHAKHEIYCLVTSSMLLMLCVWFAKHLEVGVLLSTLTFLSGGMLMVLSPIDSENRRLDEDEKKHCKKRTGILTVVFGLLYAILAFWKQDFYAVPISIGILLTAGLQLPYLVKKCLSRRKYEE